MPVGGVRYVDEFTERLRQQFSWAYGLKDQLGFGLRQRLREGYSAKDFRADALAGVVVGIVALPLSMALAVAVGPGGEVPPQHGLYSAIIAGIVCALLGGTRAQVTGPTAAFVVILVPIVRNYGLAGLLCAGAMAGVLLVLMGLARLGRLMQFIPHPVTTGFTAGIAVVIAVMQLKDALGLRIAGNPDGIFAFVRALWASAGTASGWDAAVCAVTLAMLVGVPRVIRRIPAPLIALVGVAGLVALAERLLPGFEVATIGSRFSTVIGGETVRGIPPLPPLPLWPWQVGGAELRLDYAMIRELFPSAFAIAMLGAIESLMAAVISDGMTGTKHDPNAELIALGIANLVCPFFGGIPATGALARTATNIRAGAQSPLAAVIHGLFVLACTIALAPLVAYLPMAGLAALMLIVAKNMSEARHFVKLTRIAPRPDVVVLWTCFVLTVVFDMVTAVSVGVVLAALLFMRRMAVLTKITLEPSARGHAEMPPGVRLYEIAGPLFFGAANVALGKLDTVGGDARVVILSMRQVEVMDATGLVALTSVLERLQRGERKVVVAGLQAEPAELLENAGIRRVPGKLAFAPDVETAVSMAIAHAAGDEPPPPSS